MLAGVLCAMATAVPAAGLRPPAVPLVACDPYFSIWSAADQLTDAETTHWTGKPHPLTSLVRIDGSRLSRHGQPTQGPAGDGADRAESSGRRARCYTFRAGGVELTLTFLTPALPDDLDLLARPVTYLTYEFRALDGGPHRVESTSRLRADRRRHGRSAGG